MRSSFQEKNKWKKYVYSRLSLGILLLLIFVLGRAAVRAYDKQETSAESLRESQTELYELEARRASLKNDIESLDTEEGRERELRKKYNVAKPGEEMLIIVEERE